MKRYLELDPWKIIEQGFHRSYNRISESIFSLGNGRMGHRANFEEQYSGDSLQGNYIAGIYYPDKTRVGWWKNGYPEYFAKVLNAPNWIGIDIEIDGETLDLAHCEVNDFYRTLDMAKGYLERRFEATLKSGKIVKVQATRFCSIVDDECGAIRYRVTAVNFAGTLTVRPYIDGDIENEDANYDEKFWNEVSQSTSHDESYVTVDTKKTNFRVCTGMKFNIEKDGEAIDFNPFEFTRPKYASSAVELPIRDGEQVTVYKYAAVLTSENHERENLQAKCEQQLHLNFEKGFDQMMEEQAAAWAGKWKESDIIIDGDVAAQQGIRFNIFQLNQTYTGEDSRLNIGPKGFTGEKYGGSTYWDTEAYCLPFYLATAEPRVARNLLIYRYHHLPKAIENAEKLGFKDGAALYPMVTMNGEECHNEWEITFEEIHRNGAIAYAIYNYINYTGDKSYLVEYGLEVLIGIARFWAQRVHWSQRKELYVMHGVTGPNEYENNVNNNWYTSTIALWCLEYTLEAIEYVREKDEKQYEELVERIKFYEHTETKKWQHILANMYRPYDEKLDIFLQQDDYMDKEQLLVKDIPAEEKPLHQHWSWDRILRSCFIKQADVLQGLFFFEHRYDKDTIRRNFEFYEPRTVHESSLSPCVHAILASSIGAENKAYEMYLRTARLDLDDYNNDTEDGCHITSMAGTWMAIVHGFGGMRVREDQLNFDPFIPSQWDRYQFKIRWRGRIIKVTIDKTKTTITNESDQEVKVLLHGQALNLAANSELVK